MLRFLNRVHLLKKFLCNLRLQIDPKTILSFYFENKKSVVKIQKIKDNQFLPWKKACKFKRIILEIQI